MNKLKGRGLGKSWVPQHFVLKADAFYYTPNKTYSHKEKKISLVKAKIGTAQHYTKKENAFGIMDARKRALHIMSAESESLMHEWIRALIAVRTALEGRARDSKPNPLNPRFPDIPSLPLPRKDNEQGQADVAESPSPARAQASATYLAHLTDDSDDNDDELYPDVGNDCRSRPPECMPAPAPAAGSSRSRATAALVARRANNNSDDGSGSVRPAPSLMTAPGAPPPEDPLGLADRAQSDDHSREGRARRKQDPSPTRSRSCVISPARALTASPRVDAAPAGAVARGVLLPAKPLAPAFSRQMVSGQVYSCLLRAVASQHLDPDCADTSPALESAGFLKKLQA